MSLKSSSLGTVASAARGLLITSGTNATPIVATITAGHRLKNNDRIAIAGVTTLTAMNGDWTVSAVAATTAALNESAGNGAFGGTAVVAKLCDRTPFYSRHASVVNLADMGATAFAGTVVLEAADSVDATQFYYTNASGVATAGFKDALMSGEIAIPAVTTAGLGLALEVSLARYMTLRCTAFTSGALHASMLA